MIIFQLDRIAEVIAYRRKTMENKNPFCGKVGGRQAYLQFQNQEAKKSCMCNRHDKRVPGGAMMVGSSDSETISPICLTCSCFCSRAPWGFLRRGPLGLPHPSEPRVIWPGVSLEVVQPKWIGRWGLGNGSLQQGACCICLEPLRVEKCNPRYPFLSREDVSKTSLVCNLQWQAGSRVEALATRAG
jgi:hypothetical protein